jgi:DNA invertase Pin-like site-specific DNA recombinase
MNRKELEGKRYISLVRASDEAQAENSTDAQLAMLDDAARKMGMVFVDKIVLKGVTGSLPGRRDDMAAVLHRKKTANDFDVLVCQRLDRLTRGGSDHGFWFEHECTCAGIRLLIVGDDIPEGRYSSLIKVAKYEAAKEQAFSISQRSTQGAQLALEQGRNATSSRTPYGCWRMYLNADDKPLHLIRNLGDGRQQKLHAETHAVIDTYGEVGGGGRGHYRKQKTEKTLIVPGDADKVEVVREIFRLHYLQGWGGKRIADLLNRNGISSPEGKAWSQHQVEVIYEQEVYTGRSVGNRITSAIYHSRSPNAPKPSDLDPSIHATAKTIPPRQRPREEWFVQEQPKMADYLQPDVRARAMAGHERLWERRGDPHRPKRSKSKHKASDYLLSGLLSAKQDGAPLVGVLCGPAQKRVRYYRHRRGRTGYRKDSVFNRMFPAEPLEKAVLALVQEVLADVPRLRERVEAYVKEQSEAAPMSAEQIDELRKQREAVRRRTELMLSTFDEETLADAPQAMERLRAERRRLDEQIAAAEAAAHAGGVDPAQLADDVVARVSALSEGLSDMPKFALREFLGSVVESVVGDMETKQVEVTLALPSWAFGQNRDAKPMRLVGTSASSASYETHRVLTLKLAEADCRYVLSRTACYDCRRRPAA